MSIKSGQQIDKTTLSATTDSTVANPATGTSHEVRLIVHEEGGGSATVDLYLSANATSDSGERIEQITLGANGTDEFKPVVVGAGQYLIVQSSVGNVNYHGSYTYRDGADVL